jgi:hypothetical protein
MWTQLVQLLLDATSAAVLCELWAILFALVGLVAWSILRAFGRAPNLRGLAVVLVPVLAVLERINFYFTRIFVPAFAFIWVMSQHGPPMEDWFACFDWESKRGIGKASIHTGWAHSLAIALWATRRSARVGGDIGCGSRARERGVG